MKFNTGLALQLKEWMLEYPDEFDMTDWHCGVKFDIGGKAIDLKVPDAVWISESGGVFSSKDPSLAHLAGENGGILAIDAAKFLLGFDADSMEGDKFFYLHLWSNPYCLDIMKAMGAGDKHKAALIAASYIDHFIATRS